MEADDRGLYILWIHLPEPVRVTVGALGLLDLPAGGYAYVGTAQRNRSASIRRHLRVEKPMRWHIDYLRPHGEIVAVSLRQGPRSGECRLVRELMAFGGAERAHPQFGSSDCRCGGHLLHFPEGGPGAGWSAALRRFRGQSAQGAR